MVYLLELYFTVLQTFSFIKSSMFTTLHANIVITNNVYRSIYWSSIFANIPFFN